MAPLWLDLLDPDEDDTDDEPKADDGDDDEVGRGNWRQPPQPNSRLQEVIEFERLNLPGYG